MNRLPKRAGNSLFTSRYRFARAPNLVIKETATTDLMVPFLLWL